MFSSKMGFLQSSLKPGGPVGYPAIFCVFRHGRNEGKSKDFVCVGVFMCICLCECVCGVCVAVCLYVCVYVLGVKQNWILKPNTDL